MINACESEPTTSMEEILGEEIELRKVEDRLIKNFADVFGAKKVTEEISDISANA